MSPKLIKLAQVFGYSFLIIALISLTQGLVIFSELFDSVTLTLSIALIVSAILGLVACFLLKRLQLWQSFPLIGQFERSKKNLIFLLIFTVLIAVLLSITSYWLNAHFGGGQSQAFLKSLTSDAGFLWLAVIATVVFAPWFEEVFYRGFLTFELEQLGVHKALVVIIPSVIWAVTHAQYSVFHLTQLVVIGCLLSMITLATRHIGYAVLLHAVFNLTTWVLYFGVDIN